MTPEDHEIFKRHMPLYECFKKHAFIRNYSKEVYNELIYLYTKYINTKHAFAHWCTSCRMELVNYLYAWYTNELQTTWYREQEAAALLAAQEVGQEIEPEVGLEIEPAPAPIKRGRKPKTK